MTKIVVTGAAGFLGTSLVKELLRSGCFVYAIVRPGSKHNERLIKEKNVRLIPVEINEYNQLPNLIIDRCEFFFHLAWQGARDDFSEQKKNIDYTIAALEAAKALSCKRFICIGSQAEYGLRSCLTTEETLPDPNTSYGAAKLATLYLSRNRAEQLGIEWIWGRVFSVYGKYEPRGRMLPDLIAALQQKKSFQLTSATQSWDYLYSEDAAEALVALMEHGHAGEIYNIANGGVHPLRYFTEQLREYFAPEAKLYYGEERRQIVSLQPSVEKIRKDTGWFARTGFVEGIKQTYNS